MFVLLAAKRLPLPTKKESLLFFALGALGYAGQSFCYFTALNYASSSTVSLLLYTYPALVMLGSAAVFKEKITVKKAEALCLALNGAFVIIGTKFDAGVRGGSPCPAVRCILLDLYFDQLQSRKGRTGDIVLGVYYAGGCGGVWDHQHARGL